MNITSYDELNKLEIVHIFDYYDFPMFFISKSSEPNYYLNYYIENLNGEKDKWLFAQISNKERLELIERRITVLGLFSKLYDKSRFYHLYLNSLSLNTEVKMTLEKIDENNHDVESFPLTDFEVEVDLLTNEPLNKINIDIVDSSKFKFILKDKTNSHDISLDLFIDIFGSFKKTIKQLADHIGSTVLNEHVNQSIDIKIDSLQPSSFGVYLKMENDLLEFESLSLEYFFQLIDEITIKDKRTLEESIQVDEIYTLDTIKNVHSLLSIVSDNNFSLQLEGSTKNDNDPRIVKFDSSFYSKINVLEDILKENSKSTKEFIDIDGILTSINTTYNNLRITTTDSGEISGKLSKELFQKLKNDNELQFLVPRYIKARLLKEIKIDLVEGLSTTKYTLMEFDQSAELGDS